MAELLLETEIKKEKGYLYFCKTNEKGNITVNRAKMGRPKKEE